MYEIPIKTLVYKKRSNSAIYIYNIPYIYTHLLCDLWHLSAHRRTFLWWTEITAGHTWSQCRSACLRIKNAVVCIFFVVVYWCADLCCGTMCPAVTLVHHRDALTAADGCQSQHSSACIKFQDPHTHWTVLTLTDVTSCQCTSVYHSTPKRT